MPVNTPDDMDDQNGTVGDKFMREVSPAAANIPYMTCVGNHEEAVH